MHDGDSVQHLLFVDATNTCERLSKALIAASSKRTGQTLAIGGSDGTLFFPMDDRDGIMVWQRPVRNRSSEYCIQRTKFYERRPKEMNDKQERGLLGRNRRIATVHFVIILPCVSTEILFRLRPVYLKTTR